MLVNAGGAQKEFLGADFYGKFVCEIEKTADECYTNDGKENKIIVSCKSAGGRCE